MTAIPETVAVVDVVACLATPIAHFTIVLAPCMDSSIADSDLGPMSSFALEIGGCVHVVVDTATNTSYGVSSGKAVRASVYGQAFILEGLFQSADAAGDLAGFGIVSAEVLDFTL